MKRFVNISAEELIAELMKIGVKVQEAGGSFTWRVAGKERVFEIIPDLKKLGSVWIYTSLSVGGSSVRGCGKDAIRVCAGVLERGKFRPTAKSKTVYRTAPNGAENRVRVFLDRLTAEIREAYKGASRTKKCYCGGIMILRKGKNGDFLGCSNFPGCKRTESVKG